MAYDAKVILDSVAPCGVRLTTMQLTYPRFVHSEFMTHRCFARNSASSRAIPFERMQNDILADPVWPLVWQAEAGGMQGVGEIPEALRPLASAIWSRSLRQESQNASLLRNVEDTARELLERVTLSRDPTTGDRSLKINGDAYGLTAKEVLGLVEFVEDRSGAFDDGTRVKVHKTLPNRLMESKMWITVIATATDWQNFFRLRCHPDAEVHIQKIAYMARDLYTTHSPSQLDEGEWHRPFVTGYDEDELATELMEAVGCGELYMPFATVGHDGTPGDTKTYWLNCVSAARVARVSYLTHEGVKDWRKDLDLSHRLMTGSGFGHWSPPEHVGQASSDAKLRSGPFRGWAQFRKQFAQECAPEAGNP